MLSDTFDYEVGQKIRMGNRRFTVSVCHDGQIVQVFQALPEWFGTVVAVTVL